MSTQLVLSKRSAAASRSHRQDHWLHACICCASDQAFDSTQHAESTAILPQRSTGSRLKTCRSSFRIAWEQLSARVRMYRLGRGRRLTLAKARCCWAWQLAWASSLATTFLRRASASSAAWIRSLSPICNNSVALATGWKMLFQLLQKLGNIC